MSVDVPNLELTTQNLELRPDYLVIGHVAKDLLSNGDVAPGGTVTYSAMSAQRLGLQAGVVTSCAPDDEMLLEPLREAGVWVVVQPSIGTTTFTNRYDTDGRRTQVLGARATPLTLDHVPDAWRDAPIIHLGPIAQELPNDMAHAFGEGLLGITPQGWLRQWDEAGNVLHSAWPIPSVLLGLPANACLIMSMEDLGFDPSLIEEYINLAPILALTNGYDEASVYWHGVRTRVPTLKREALDPTGAGDVFATAFLIRYLETKDVLTATQFAHATAALAIGAQGTDGIPTRTQIQIY